jgi:S-adenosylmethionine hydrolase
MIVLFTDFGLHGPYTGQMKAVLHQTAPGITVIDLFADAPVGNPKASAYPLAAYAGWFAAGTIFFCVVDPGVGGARPAVILEADGRWTFSDLPTGAAFWYENSNGLSEIAVNQGRADRDLGLSIGIPVAIVS